MLSKFDQCFQSLNYRGTLHEFLNRSTKEGSILVGGSRILSTHCTYTYNSHNTVYCSHRSLGSKKGADRRRAQDPVVWRTRGCPARPRLRLPANCSQDICTRSCILAGDGSVAYYIIRWTRGWLGAWPGAGHWTACLPVSSSCFLYWNRTVGVCILRKMAFKTVLNNY